MTLKDAVFPSANLVRAMRRLAPALACVLVLGGCGSETPRSAAPGPRAERKALAGAPAPLARLHRQENQLLGGGAGAFKARLRALRGYPVVVNKWASWCGPCRSEFPFLQRQSVQRGKRIAFLGVNANDNDGAARRFLRQLPVSYPSYSDPDLKIAAVFGGVQAFPTTAFYDRRGGLAFVHQGAYATERKLAQDIERYAR
jgi:cytochrome c biogenesis protein CcmG, thiol:disulfide interchange protein DsbE